MKNDMLVKVSEAAVRCRVCELRFVPKEPSDSKMHKERHKQLAKGGLPLELRNFQKRFGWAVAYNAGGIDLLKDEQNPEVGKLAVAYAWWARARMSGIDESEFDEFMAAHLHIIDALVEGNAEECEQAKDAIERWERYAG